jgi:tRNA A-37 threonylcarbamoyl transferase component Bud32/tetratricopeptide (TPR) repeat protein
VAARRVTARVQALFHAVADLSLSDRERFFAEHEIDPTTRSEVEALLAFDLPATTSWDREISRTAGQALNQLGRSDLNCGPYRLGDVLGRGGMGTVYSAERADGEVRQRVAIKLLRPGANDPHLRQRFLAERQILAALSHANIARLLDAGHREDGQPYLAMEFVEGKAIDVYTTNLDIRQKIVLFLRVCNAVSYLHRNLLVHRDLKPANILVTNEGEPKLLDFGIAKMLDLDTGSTLSGSHMLTPDYASPEQVTGSPITTATDIYSLGAVLYKLLTGCSPHRFENNSVEAIASTISHGRIDPPSKRSPKLEGDLDIILMKALRKEPWERYETVEQFAADLENCLELRPIYARGNDGWYRMRKFFRRHWVPVAAAALALLGLVIGLAVALHERTIAQRRFLEVRQLANKLFDVDMEIRKVAGATKARQLIVDTSLDYLRRLSADTRGDNDLALELGNAYMRVARVQGVPISANLGQMDQAEQSLQIAEKLVHSVAASQPSNRTAMLRAAQIAHDRMILARLDRRSDDALVLARKSAEWLEKFHAGEADRADSSAILVVYLNVADQLMLSRRFDDAVNLCRRGSELARFFGSEPYLGTFHWVSAEVFRRQGDLDDALTEIEESVKALEPNFEKADQGRIENLVLALIYQGRILGEEDAISLGRRGEAVAVLERAFNLADQYVHQDPNDQTARGRIAMAGLLMASILRRSDSRRAMALYDHVLRHMSEIKDNSSFRRFEVTALVGSSYTLRQLGDAAKARERLDAAFERLRQIDAYPKPKIKPRSEPDSALCALASYEADIGNIHEAIETYTKLLGLILAWGTKPEASLDDAVDLSRVLGALAALHQRAGQPEVAAPLQKQRVELWRRWETTLPLNDFVHRQLLEVSREQPPPLRSGSDGRRMHGAYEAAATP